MSLSLNSVTDGSDCMAATASGSEDGSDGQPYTTTPVFDFCSLSNSLESHAADLTSATAKQPPSRKIGRQFSQSDIGPLVPEAGRQDDTVPPNTSAKSCWMTDHERPTDASPVTEQSNSVDRAREGEESDSENDSTSRSILASTAFVWLPLCRPVQNRSNTEKKFSTDLYFDEAHKCARLQARRNALADPGQMPMKQETRERIQKEVACRKTSMARKVSQYFKAIVSDDYEVDLI